MKDAYDWLIVDGKWPKWIQNHKLRIDYNDPLTWDPKNWGEWGSERKGGPPVRLPSDDRFWYVDRVKVAKFILKYPNRKGNTKKVGKKFLIRVGLMEVVSTEHEEVAKAALAALNGGNIPRTLALESPYVNVIYHDQD